METREYYIYQQIPSGGISYDTTECFKKDLSILPFNSVFFYDKCKSKYHNIAVSDLSIIPSIKRKIFIFENKKEFEEALKNKELERYNNYTILEDFKGVE